MKTGEESSEKNDKGDHVCGLAATANVKKNSETLGLNPLSEECCIYKVPKRLRVLNDKAYTPQVVSTGPFHRDKKQLQEMEEHKRMHLQDFLKWSNASLEDFIELIKEYCLPEEQLLSDVLEDLNNYCGRDWPRWKANLRQNYFQNPWSIISVINIAAAFPPTHHHPSGVFYYSNRLESTL